MYNKKTGYSFRSIMGRSLTGRMFPKKKRVSIPPRLKKAIRRGRRIHMKRRFAAARRVRNLIKRMNGSGKGITTVGWPRKG